MTARISVVIPAHDEAAVIGRLLAQLVGDVRSPGLEIVVVANGCRDATATVARGFGRRVRVVEIPEASKIAALRAGDRAAKAFPRAYVDADVRVSADALLALGHLLETPGGPLVASPRLQVDTTGASWFVRSHHRIWELTDYRQHDHIGSGVYALSAAGRARFGEWPDVIADDRFVQQLFRPDERATLDEHSFTVPSARTIRAHLRRTTRIARGNLELADASTPVDEAAPAPEPAPSPAPSGDRASNLVGRVARRPALWPAFAVYSVTATVPKLRAIRQVDRREEAAWARDDARTTV